MTHIRPALFLLALAASHVAAALESCEPFDLSQDRVARLGHVRADAKRVYFDSTPGTPARGARPYLVPGDEPIVWWSAEGFHCASFRNAKGRVTTGFLPAASLDVDALPPAPAASAWVGEWTRDSEASITIEAVGGDRIAVSGFATWGGNDPRRVEAGGVNIGEIERTIVRVDGAKLRFATADGDVDDQGCIVTMQRLDDVLLVDDNFRCGGMNVTFKGIY